MSRLLDMLLGRKSPDTRHEESQNAALALLHKEQKRLDTNQARIEALEAQVQAHVSNGGRHVDRNEP